MNSAIFGKGRMALWTVASLALGIAVPALAREPVAVFNIPSEPASVSIPALARQSGIQILANADDLSGVVTPAVTGTFSPDMALQKLLTGTPLVVRQTRSGTLMVVRLAVQSQEEPEAASDRVPQEVLVIGFRKSYADSIRMKRNAIGISDSISSDGLGRFPDLNAGEAVQRITGVQINREADSRNATINLRGMPGTYARTTINGLAFAEPVLDSSIPLGAFDTDIFSAISINKSPAAADQSGGLSGNIDLQIKPASSRKPGGQYKVGYEYDELGDRTSPALTIGYNARPGQKLAVFGIVAIKAESFRRDSIYFNQYSPLNALTPGFATAYADYYAPYAADGSCSAGLACSALGTEKKGRGGVLYPSDLRQLVKSNEGTLVTAAAGADYRFDDRLLLRINGFSTSRDLGRNSTRLTEIDLRPSMVQVNPEVGPAALPDGTALIDRFSFSNPQINTSYRAEPALQQTWFVNGSLDWSGDTSHVVATVVVSRAKNSGSQTQIDWRTVPQSGAGNGISGRFYSGGENVLDYILTVTPPEPVSVTAGPFTWLGLSNPAFQQNARGDQLVVAGTAGSAATRLASAQIDIDRAVSFGSVKSLSVGLRIERDTFASSGFRTSAKGVQTADIDGALLIDSPYNDDFFGGAAPGYFSRMSAIDYAYAVSHFRPVSVAPGDLVTPTGWINDPTNLSYSANNFTVRNAVGSAYVMGAFSTEIMGLPVRGSAGVRYEATHQDIDALDKKTDLAGNISYVPESFSQSYGNWLPSLLVAANLPQGLTLRGAYYRTFVRPQPRNLSPATSVAVTSTGFNVAYGGYDLKPFTADSADLSLEWYHSHGMVSFDVFEKVVRNLVAEETRLDRLCPADATALGLGHLRVSGNACLSDIMVGGQPAIVMASGSFNQPDPVHVRGVEFSVQQTFAFLPGILRNLGGVFNYSYTQVMGRNPDGSKAVLPGVSANAYNLIGFYETPRFGVRVVYNHRDAYVLTGGTTFSGGASRVKPRGQLDASLSFAVAPRLSVSLDGYNLTNARRSQYQTFEAMPRANDYDGRTFTLVMRSTF